MDFRDTFRQSDTRSDSRDAEMHRVPGPHVTAGSAVEEARASVA